MDCKDGSIKMIQHKNKIHIINLNKVRCIVIIKKEDIKAMTIRLWYNPEHIDYIILCDYEKNQFFIENDFCLTFLHHVFPIFDTSNQEDFFKALKQKYPEHPFWALNEKLRKKKIE